MKIFNSIYSHGFVRAAVCVPEVRTADVQFNTERILAMAGLASQNRATLVLFPELCITAYAIDDLLQQSAILAKALNALWQIKEHSQKLNSILIVGLPMRFRDKLFNCAAVIYSGKIIGIVPKSYLPNYREFYEKRHFVSGFEADFTQVELFGESIPFGNNLVFDVMQDADNSFCYEKNIFTFGIEICEDVWVPISPSNYAALAGATVLCNLSASDITIGKADYRRALCQSQSGKTTSAYLYTAAGIGESTTDLAWDGQSIICENGNLLSEGKRFSFQEQMIINDIHVAKLIQERQRLSSFADTALQHKQALQQIKRVEFEYKIPDQEIPLIRIIERFPFVPNDEKKRSANCYEAYNIQVFGLIKRLRSTGINRIVIGVSGGLDSTHALIVAVKAMDILGLDRKNILAYTMPGFATTDKTKNNAIMLADALGVSISEIDIKPSCLQMLTDINHPFARGEKIYDTTFENVQAGERTSHLFRLANQNSALVLGTGDLSELALGWCTYGVGDQMSHYNVNSSVPKTLIKHLIRWAITTNQYDKKADAVLQSILDSEISPELVPTSDSGEPQSTEKYIGPYNLQDFNLYYITRYGLLPSTVAFLSWNAWGNKSEGKWSNDIPLEKREEYSLREIVKWLEVFIKRFFGSTQFKRSAMPNGPKVLSGGSLSPRGDWRAPSDSVAEVWLEELKNVVVTDLTL